MGFFSSIGDFVSDAWDGVKDVFGGVKDVVGGVVDTVSPILGPVGNVVSGLLGSDSQQSVNSQNTAFAREQLQFQKDYIQNRLQWQVEDAKKAGLHPMVAAGISPTSFSPVSLNNSPVSTDWVANTGQSLAYASAKAKDRQQQQQAWNYTMEMNEAQIEGVRLDNELKVMQIMSQLALLNQTGPSAPSVDGKKSGVIDGQADSFSNFGSSPVNLYSTARVGDILLTVLNPDIADSLTESQFAHASATFAREMESQRNPKLYADAFKQLTAREQKAVLDGRAVFEYVPGVGGYMLTYPRTLNTKHAVGGRLRY